MKEQGDERGSAPFKRGNERGNAPFQTPFTGHYSKKENNRRGTRLFFLDV